MMERLKKIPEQMVRVAVVFIVFIFSVIAIRTFVIPASLKETGMHRTLTLAREAGKKLNYAGALVCEECHDDIVDLKKGGYHRNLSCETCHGPAKAHTEDPGENTPTVPRERAFCPRCHDYNASRPTGFPQINPIIHNPMKRCIECHDAHNPVPSEVPRECAACHAEIFRTKAVSHHALVQCITCHDVPEGHKVSPRKVKPTKPESRAFCEKCHEKGSKGQGVPQGVPKIDAATHGSKYLCWFCHYPHMPEAR